MNSRNNRNSTIQVYDRLLKYQNTKAQTSDARIDLTIGGCLMLISIYNLVNDHLSDCPKSESEKSVNSTKSTIDLICFIVAMAMVIVEGVRVSLLNTQGLEVLREGGFNNEFELQNHLRDRLTQDNAEAVALDQVYNDANAGDDVELATLSSDSVSSMPNQPNLNAAYVTSESSNASLIRESNHSVSPPLNR